VKAAYVTSKKREEGGGDVGERTLRIAYRKDRKKLIWNHHQIPGKDYVGEEELSAWCGEASLLGVRVHFRATREAHTFGAGKKRGETREKKKSR